VQTLVIRALLVVVVASAILTAVIFVRVAVVPYSPPRPDGSVLAPSLDESAAVARLEEVSRLEDLRPEARLHAGLSQLFPRTFSDLEVETVAPGTLLLTWEGGDPSAAAILLTASLQTPGSTAALLEAVEVLLEDGVHPDRTTYLVLSTAAPGAVESGVRGAAEALLERDVELAWALGPGGGVATEMVPGIRDPLALIGVAEKGRVRLVVRELEVGSPRTATPAVGARGADDRVLAALAEDPLTPRIEGPTRELVRVLAAHSDPGTRMLATNLWLFGRPLARALAAEPGGETMVRSHLEVRRTERSSGASVGSDGTGFHLYLAPWDDLDAVLQALRKRVEPLGLEVVVAGEALDPVAGGAEEVWSAPGFRALGDAVLRSFPDALAPAPCLLPEPSDARHFRPLAREVYGFTPLRIDPEVLARRDGQDEALSAAAYLQMVRFYADLVRRAMESPGA
jgi:carboxypeptidase PM20D1